MAPGPLFPEAPHGYEREAVERYVETTERERGELAGRLEEVRRERDALERELATLRDELDGTKAAMPQVTELQARLEGLEGEYAERVRALEALLASAAREVAERYSETVSAADEGPRGTAVVRGAWSGLSSDDKWSGPSNDDDG